MDQFKVLQRFLKKEEISSKQYGKLVKKRSLIFLLLDLLLLIKVSHLIFILLNLLTPKCVLFISMHGKRG